MADINKYKPMLVIDKPFTDKVVATDFRLDVKINFGRDLPTTMPLPEHISPPCAIDVEYEGATYI